jgi:hypothetical protein
MRNLIESSGSILRQRAHLLVDHRVDCRLELAAPHFVWAIEPIDIRGVVRVDDQDPIPFGIVSVEPRVFITKSILNVLVFEISFQIAKLGRKWNESPIGWREEVPMVHDPPLAAHRESPSNLKVYVAEHDREGEGRWPSLRPIRLVSCHEDLVRLQAI